MTVDQDAIDQAHQNFTQIVKETSALDKGKWSEADTRLKVIDRILFEVLGWDKNEALVEEQAGSGYTDYSLKDGECTRLIVEAKKDYVRFGIENRTNGKAYKLNGASFNADGKSAVQQAVIYSAFKNTELACATNGGEWIVFRANRLGDGKDTMEGKGFVFNSLEGIQENFQRFYDLLSKHAVVNLNYRGEFQKAEGVPVRDLSFLSSPRNPDSKKVVSRGEFATDFDSIMSAFFDRLKGDQDPEMIQKCFVVSPESELADERLLRIATDLVDQVRSIETATGKELIELIKSVQATHKNRFILLVGNKGAGKSTFVDRFFQFVLPKEYKKELITLRVDLSKSPNDISKAMQWLDRELLQRCEEAVFNKDTDSGEAWNEYVGKIFFDEYQRWSTRTLPDLYESDKTQFKIEFGRHIEQIRETRPSEYIRRLISYMTKSNGKIPCLLFDNTDHFSIEFQEAVFSYARALYESELCIVIMPITDKTSWQLSKQGALQSFESVSLLLPIPEPEKVIERRIAFLMEKLSYAEKQDKDYFLKKGIRLKLDDIGKFAASLNHVFVNTPRTAEWIGGLVNRDIRRLLDLTKDTIASPHLELDDLLKAHIASTSVVIPPYKIKNAIIKKRYDTYPVGEHSYVQNVFAFCLDIPTSPLLGLRIIQYLRDATANSETGKYDFIPLDKIYDYFSMLGVPRAATEVCVRELLSKGLVLNYDTSVTEVHSSCKLEASPSGRVHLGWATTDWDYVGIMKDITPIRDKEVCEEIRNCYRDYKHLWAHSIKLFVDYLINEDGLYCQIPDHSNFARQNLIGKGLDRLSKNLQKKTDEIADLSEMLKKAS